GGTGQSRLLASRVVVDGSGAAGRVAAMYLVAAGVGTVIVDGALDTPVRDARFPLARGDVGRTLADALARALGGHNPDVRVVIAPTAAAAAAAAETETETETETERNTGAEPAASSARAHRVIIDGDADDLPLGDAFARAGAAVSSLVHRLATEAAP
ncbi:MAG TPA: ThiF family adenylyltransferase, partial [Kofleriaceae bacterium]|nr:ThiF family adenylyltransferase [Kofleriaceae bacterium]